MPKVKFSDFSRGEISPNVYGNSRLQVNQSGARQLINMWPTAKGAVVKRPGTQYLGPAPIYGSRARLIPFKFSTLQQYELIFQNLIAFIMKDGEYVLVPQPTINPALCDVERLSDGTVRIYTNAAHGLSVGQFIFIGSNTPASFAEIRYRYFRVKAVPGATTFDIENRDGSAAGAASSIPLATGITYGRLASFAIPWSTAELFDGDLDYDQSTNTIFVSHPNHRTRVITRTDHHLWTVSNFEASPEEPSPAALTDTAAPSGVLTIKYAVTAINDTTKEESLAAVHVIENTDEPTRGSPDDPITLEWTKNANAGTYRVYRAINGIFGLLDEARWVSGPNVSYSDLGDRVPLLEIGPPLTVETPFDTSGNYPKAVSLFQQRIWFGGTLEDVNGLFASRSGSFRSFAQEEVVVDSSPIAQLLSGNGVQEVRYLVAARDILVMTDQGEWIFDKGEQGIITPSSGLISQGDWGTAKVKPLKVGNTVLFVEQSGRMVRDIAYDVSSDGFGGLDLSAASDHLFESSSIVRWCHARKPYKVVFAILEDGNAVAMSYDREQESFGWSRQETAGLFDDCIAVREVDVDNIYLSVKRGADYYIERLNMREVRNDSDGNYLDCWQRRRLVTDYKAAALLEIREDPDDGWKWKIQFGSGDIVQHWPAIMDLTDAATALFPNIENSPVVFTQDPNPPAAGTWYVINRFIGGAPTWSTETTNAAGMTVIPIVTTRLDRREDETEFRRQTFPGSVYYGTGTFLNTHMIPAVSTRRGVVSPRFRGDKEWWNNAGGTVVPVNVTSLNSDKAYAIVTLGYPYRAMIETMEIDPPEEVLDSSNVRTSHLLIRVNDAWDFRFMRASQDQPASTLQVIRHARSRFDPIRNLIRSAHIEVPMLSKWDTRSSVVVISDVPFPLTIQAIGMRVEAGND